MNSKKRTTKQSSTEAPRNLSEVSIDALKRRYQVFVSSTYEDLRIERQYLIQALLETKCIPIGMELFPAASTSQWELIQRLIEECDYFIVVVAGRYGSLHKSGLSYTELEFNHAQKTGKPILGFYHQNLDDLTGDKLEKNDQSRTKLLQFTQKVKDKICRSWSSPAELGSAVKSAIIHALEYDPKPGWIRADSAPSLDLIKKLRQRVADLEEQSKKKRSTSVEFAGGTEVLEIPLVIEYAFEKRKSIIEHIGARREATKQTKYTVIETWDGLVELLSGPLREGQTLEFLEAEMNSSLSTRYRPEIEKISSADFRAYIFTYTLESILNTLMARKLINVSLAKYDRWEGLISPEKWRFTPIGLQYLSEIRAVKSKL